MSKYQLNQAQKEAVEYINGPLLIVAGAGTGKTSVITSKICYLLEKKLAQPEQILALTFNDKAATEIQERVDEMINIGYTELNISTFHTFCQRVLERHAINIGLNSNFKLLTETAAWVLVRQNLSKFNLNYYRPMGNPMRHVHELLKHFSKCKDELITPEEYVAFAESTAKDSGTVNLEDKNRLTEIANAYHLYNQLLLDNGLLDFGDLIFYTVNLFFQRPVVLKKFQSQFKYILVDEFQDVNYAQYKLVKLLADVQSQLTVVGDDDQSIYAFRGASIANILRFKDDFPDTKKIVLHENYRSSQTILNVAYQSIQNNNPDRLEIKLGINKHLTSKTTHQESQVIHIHATTLDEEVRLVINEITRLKTADINTTWDDFAILVRANNHADPFINQLQANGIPYEFIASSGLYRQPIILDAINYLKLLDNYHESSAIFRLLCLPFLHFKENDLQKITYNAKKKATTYYEILKRAPEFGLSQEGVAVCNKLIELIYDGMKRSRKDKPSVILYNFLEKSGYLNYLTKKEDQGNSQVIRQIHYLKQFFEYLSEYESITPEAQISQFLEHFTMVVESGDRGALYQPSDTPDSVNIMTVHASKGLEYKYVFIANLVEDRFPSRSRGDGIEIPPELVKEQLPEGDSHIQEERRLFYVAMTRAKERLYFCSANDYGGVRTKKISRFLVELGYKITEQKTEKEQTIIAEKKNTPNSVHQGGSVYELPKAFSFSQIRTYEVCPYQYKLAHILHIPTKGNASFSFGTTMHGTLQAFYQRIQELNARQQISLFDATPKKTTAASEPTVKVPTIEDLLALYEKNWIGDWYKNQHQREEYYQKGKDILKTFYKAQENNWSIPTNLESWFRIKVGDRLIHGRIDRIDKLPDGTLEIIDYKTGKSKEKLTSEDKEQLLIYQIAIEQLPEYRHLGKPSKLTFYYLNDEIRTSFLGETQELEKLKVKLQNTIGQIHARNFMATPSQFACDNCDFREICDYRI